MAQKSIVLLKNDGILPLSKDQTVAVIGPNADSVSVLLGNYNGTPSYTTTLLDSIRAVCPNTLYARGSNLFRKPSAWSEKPLHEALITAKRADTVILCMGLDPSIEGEEGAGPNGGDKLDLELPAVQRELVDAVVALGKPTVFVNVSGSCINLEREDRTCNAVLQCFYPGAEGGNALADILFGKVSPSGRLPVSFYRSVDDLPPFEDYSMENRTYRFFKGKCVYDFGHGLSYAKVLEHWLDDYTVELFNESDWDTDYSVLRFAYEPHKTLKDFQCIHLGAHERVRLCFDKKEEQEK